MKTNIAYIEVYADCIKHGVATVNSKVKWGGCYHHFDIPSEYLLSGKFIKVIRYGESMFQFGGEIITIDKDRIYDEMPED